MSDSNALMNIGDLAKPANTLIEKISAAIGAIWEPYQIRRIARAEADADKIRAIAQIEVTELQQRALRRFLAEEAKKQNNMENVIRKAIPELTEQARPQDVEDDWISHFFDKSRLISDEQMQTLWARILAGEANSPGRFSKRTIDRLAEFDKSDAVQFLRLCRFGVSIDEVIPLVYDTEHSIYTSNGVTFESLSHLESIGLVTFDPLTGYVLRGLNKKDYVRYYGQRIWLEFPEPENNDMSIGKVMLTKAGVELASICNAEPVEGFADYLREQWRKLGYKTDPEPGTTPAADN